MPAFFPRAVPRQFPLTPPDNASFYTAKGYTSKHSSVAAYPPSTNMAYHNDFAYECPDQYGQSQAFAPPPIPYQQQSGYDAIASEYALSGPHGEPLGAPTLPPIRLQRTMQDVINRQYQLQEQHLCAEQPKNEKPIGGVSAQLDYEMEQMTDFVAEMAQGMYGLFTSNICIADIDLVQSIQPGVPSSPQFRKWVSQVLCATRLPSATILLSLSYLSSRMCMLSVGGPHKTSEGQVYRLLTIALILGSKFLDDNTFQNRSWSEVSGIKVAELNALEKEWLLAIRFDLHRDPKESQGFTTWLAQWLHYESSGGSSSSRSSSRRTSLQRQRSTRQRPLQSVGQTQSQQVEQPQTHRQPTQPAKLTVPDFDYTRLPLPAQYPTLARVSYDQWLPPPSLESLPMATQQPKLQATPDFYASRRDWVPESYYRNDMFSYSSGSHLTLPPPPPTGYGHSFYTPDFLDSGWNSHGVGCGCPHCMRHHHSYLAPHCYGLQTVAG